MRSDKRPQNKATMEESPVPESSPKQRKNYNHGKLHRYDLDCSFRGYDDDCKHCRRVESAELEERNEYKIRREREMRHKNENRERQRSRDWKYQDDDFDFVRVPIHEKWECCKINGDIIWDQWNYDPQFGKWNRFRIIINEIHGESKPNFTWF